MHQLKLIMLVIAITIPVAEMCIFKPAVKEPNIGQFSPFNDEAIARLPTKRRCVCGQDYPGKAKWPASPFNQRWILYIQLKIANSKTRLCIGTIVNSNMVITSHKCLQKTDKLSVNDVIRANKGQSSSLASANEIILSNGSDLLSPFNFVVKVKKVIYSERFAYDLAFEMVPESDVAILVVDDVYDFTKNRRGVPRWYPICLPTYNLIQMPQLLNRKGYYQGILASKETNYIYKMIVANYTTITTAESCNKRGRLGVKPFNNETLCLMFTQPSPTVEGGPLRINVDRAIEGGPKRSFLVGISTWVQKTEKNAGHKYAYFANVNSFVKYIEHHALNYESKWCGLPTLDDKSWPWEGYCGKPDTSLKCTCGYRDTKFSRVVGGEDGSLGEFPWLAKLFIGFYYSDESWEIANKTCGGSLINDRMILTAAHCFVNYNSLPDEQTFNLHNLDGDFSKNYIYINSMYTFDDTEHNIPSIRAEAEKVLFHPGHPDEMLSYRTDFDIALIILKKPLKLGFDQTAQLRIDPVCLPEVGYLKTIVGQNVTVAGWGTDDWAREGVTLTNVAKLQKVDIPIRHLNECAVIDQIEHSGAPDIPTDTKFCASSLSPWRAAGQGDSGGPLMHRKTNGAMVQVGIVSFGRLPRKAAPNKSDDKATTYYANVEVFLPYIYYYSNKYKAKFCNA